MMVLYLIAKKIGRFDIIGLVFYPIQVFSFLIIFLVSLIKKLFGLPIIWKGRVVAGKRKV